MKEIKLTKGKTAIIDDEDYESINSHHWYAKNSKGFFYAARTTGKRPNRHCIGMHNQILGIKGVDHKNGKGLDNRRENLRPANQLEQRMNSAPNKDRKFKGTKKILKE